jgi:hypothetical protein
MDFHLVLFSNYDTFYGMDGRGSIHGDYFFHRVHTGSEAYPGSYSVGLSPRVKLLDLMVKHGKKFTFTYLHYA